MDYADPITDLAFHLRTSGRASERWRAEWLDANGTIERALLATTDLRALYELFDPVAARHMGPRTNAPAGAHSDEYLQRVDAMVFKLGPAPRLADLERTFAMDRVDGLDPLVCALEHGAPPSDAWERVWGDYDDPLVEAWKRSRDVTLMRSVLRWAGVPTHDDARDAFALRSRVPKPPPLDSVVAGARHEPDRGVPFVPHPRTFETISWERRMSLPLDDVASRLAPDAVEWIRSVWPPARTVGDLNSGPVLNAMAWNPDTARVDALYAALGLGAVHRPDRVFAREGCLYVRAPRTAVREAVIAIFSEAGLTLSKRAPSTKSVTNAQRLEPDSIIVWEEEADWIAVASARYEQADPRTHPLAQRLSAALAKPVLALRVDEDRGIRDVVVHSAGAIHAPPDLTETELARIFETAPGESIPLDATPSDQFECGGFAGFIDTVGDSYANDPESAGDVLLSFVEKKKPRTRKS